MNSSKKIKAIYIAVALSFVLILLDLFVEIESLTSLGFLILGVLLIVFNRDLAAERSRIASETKSDFIKKWHYTGATYLRNRYLVLIAGVIFLMIALATFL